MTLLAKEEAKTLVSIVGREGAVAALVKSKLHSKESLAKSAKAFGLPVASKDSKSKVAKAIVRFVDRRIDEPLDVLKAMSKEELVKYFEETKCDQDELVELLESINFKSRFKSRRDLIEFAATQVSSLGIFERVANGKSKGSTSGPASTPKNEAEGSGHEDDAPNPPSEEFKGWTKGDVVWIKAQNGNVERVTYEGEAATGSVSVRHEDNTVTTKAKGDIHRSKDAAENAS